MPPLSEKGRGGKELTLSLAILGFLATGVLLLSTSRWGIGLTPDSAQYAAAARNLLMGNGLSVSYFPDQFSPLTHYPPLYPILLAGAGLSGIDPVEGARWLNAILLAGNLMLAGSLIYLSTHSYGLSFAGSFLLMASAPVVQVHLLALSEPLFIFWSLLGLSLVGLYLSKSRRTILLAASGAAALALLARYPGVALVAAGGIAILFLTDWPWKRRIGEAALYWAVSLSPFALWAVRNLISSGNAIDRPLLFHHPTKDHLSGLIDTVSAWLVPLDIFPAARLVALLSAILLLCMVIFSIRRAARSHEEASEPWTSAIPLLLVIFVVAYLFIIAAAIMLVDHLTPMNNRILSPVYVGLLVAVLSSLGRSQGGASRIPRLGAATLLFLFVAGQLPDSLSWLKLSREEGLGYASRSWQMSGLVQFASGLPPQVPILSNAPDIIYLLAMRPAYMIPRKTDSSAVLENKDYMREMEEVAGIFEEQSGFMLYFKAVRWRPYLPTESEVGEKLDLQLHASAEDGSIYRLSGLRRGTH